MKQRTKIFLILALLAIGGIGALFVFLGGPESMARRHRFDQLVKNADHASIARTAITLISQTTSPLIYTAEGCDERSLTNLPPIIRDMHPKWVSVEPGHMTIEFHGGFNHFGFNIDKSDQEWEMSWYSEGDRGDHRIQGGRCDETNTANQTMQADGAAAPRPDR